ncbi:unnamed protein product [Ilex paraguariensis]|uniref:Uncharacterized protein n=1 Tax=Ilex paraguariensis TaxID=185542 RepID=A0ABC8TFK7_9AQUA
MLDKMLEDNQRRVEESQRREALEQQRKDEERQRELELIQRQKEEAARERNLKKRNGVVKHGLGHDICSVMPQLEDWREFVLFCLLKSLLWNQTGYIPLH